MTDHIEGTAVEEVGVELVPHETLTVTPSVKAGELVERLDTIRDAMNKAMQKDVDYGVVPGTNKPTLLKPGAEKLAVLFQLDVQLENERIWGPGDHLTVMSRATVYHAPTGSRLGFGEGTCSTRERKYAYRKAERVCPACGKPAIIKGKAEYGGGWVCFRKKGGCGAKYSDGDPVIEDQKVGDVENPDLPDLWNTVVKMGEKRARVDAVLAVTGASALFTQDAEDLPASVEGMPSEPPAWASNAKDASFAEKYANVRVEDVEVVGGTDLPDVEGVTAETYQALLTAFKDAGSPKGYLEAWLDTHKVPRGSGNLAERVSMMSAAQGDELLADLRDR